MILAQRNFSKKRSSRLRKGAESCTPRQSDRAVLGTRGTAPIFQTFDPFTDIQGTRGSSPLFGANFHWHCLVDAKTNLRAAGAMHAAIFVERRKPNGFIDWCTESVGLARLGKLGQRILGNSCLDGLGVIGSASATALGRGVGHLGTPSLGNIGESLLVSLGSARLGGY